MAVTGDPRGSSEIPTRLGIMWVAVAWFGFFSYKVIAEYGSQLF